MYTESFACVTKSLMERGRGGEGERGRGGEGEKGEKGRGGEGERGRGGEGERGRGGEGERGRGGEGERGRGGEGERGRGGEGRGREIENFAYLKIPQQSVSSVKNHICAVFPPYHAKVQMCRPENETRIAIQGTAP